VATIKIKTTYQPYFGWNAIDENTYDGAPDSINKECGTGETEEEAINDLLEQLTERDTLEDEDYG